MSSPPPAISQALIYDPFKKHRGTWMSDGEFGKFVSVTVHSPDSTKYSSTSFFLHLQQLSHSQKNPVNQKLIQSTVGAQSPGSLGLVLGIVFCINLEIVSLGLETDEL